MPDAGEGITFIRGMPGKRSNSWLSMYDRSVDVLNRVTESITIPKYDFLRLIVRFWKSREEHLNLLNLFIEIKVLRTFDFRIILFHSQSICKRIYKFTNLSHRFHLKKKNKKKIGEKNVCSFNSKERDFKICPCLRQIWISIDRIPSICRYAKIK